MSGKTLKVEIGSRVRVELINEVGASEILNVALVPEEYADLRSGLLGVNTPLAQTILGRQEGEHLPYSLGDLRSVRILTVRPPTTPQSSDAVARRKAALRKAIQHSDYVNAMIFAGAVNSKWGDYDIDKLDPAQWGQDEKEDNDHDTDI